MFKGIKSFTLVELIIVVIIVGILASLGLTQYFDMVERSRTTEARIRIGNMRQLTYEYYINNGDLTGIANADVGVDNTCSSSSFYRYYVAPYSSTSVNLDAARCTSGGKTPNASRTYYLYFLFTPSTGAGTLHCNYGVSGEPCFGLPA